MAQAPRFIKAASQKRPFGSHRHDAYSPKLQRQLTLFGRHAVNLWTTLEASPKILSFCERPLIIPDLRPARPFDFWLQRADGEEFLLLNHKGDKLTPEGEENPISRLDGMAVEGIPIRCINSESLGLHRVALSNWGRIIRDLAAFSRFVPEPLCDQVKGALGSGKTIRQLQGEFAEFDSSTVQLAIFILLHQGQAFCQQLAHEEFTSDHVVTSV